MGSTVRFVATTVIITLITGIFGTVPATGQQPGEVEVLKQQLASLRSEVDQLRKEVERLKEATTVLSGNVLTAPKGRRFQFNGMDYYIVPGPESRSTQYGLEQVVPKEENPQE